MNPWKQEMTFSEDRPCGMDTLLAVPKLQGEMSSDGARRCLPDCNSSVLVHLSRSVDNATS
jgi:hypothetical protein